LGAALLGGGAMLMFLVVALAADNNGGADWEEIKHADGIRVLSTDVAQDIVKVKAIAVLAASPQAVRAVIDAVAQQPAWVPYLTETRVLKNISPDEALLYSRFDAHWPARDRDFVYRSRVSRDAAGRIVYRLESYQSPLMPERDDYVRGILMEGLYIIEPKDKDSARVEFMFHADPRGRLPLWIVNIVQRRFPFQALLGLRERLGLNAAAP
jgi:hypothetical protein